MNSEGNRMARWAGAGTRLRVRITGMRKPRAALYSSRDTPYLVGGWWEMVCNGCRFSGLYCRVCMCRVECHGVEGISRLREFLAVGWLLKLQLWQWIHSYLSTKGTSL